MVFITAEIGINHNGDIGIAKKLIDTAKNANCDAVKFQKRTIDLVYTQGFLDGPRESSWGTTQREQKEGLELGLVEYKEIDRYCKEKGIDWFASAWDLESQKFLKQFDFRFSKGTCQTDDVICYMSIFGGIIFLSQMNVRKSRGSSLPHYQ